MRIIVSLQLYLVTVANSVCSIDNFFGLFGLVSVNNISRKLEHIVHRLVLLEALWDHTVLSYMYWLTTSIWVCSYASVCTCASRTARYTVVCVCVCVCLDLL